ncbi:MAG: hypothetical protein ABIB47_00525 [Candidatus Woesearchaeota archaeon]
MKILYLCQNNKGRSIALAAYTDYFLKKRDSKNITVASAGIAYEFIESLKSRGFDGPSRTTAHILAQQGLNISDHKLTHAKEAIKGSSLILITDTSTLERTIQEFPSHQDKCFLAKEFAGFTTQTEIFGPHAESRKDSNDGNWTERVGYEHMLREIKSISRRIAKRRIAKRLR